MSSIGIVANPSSGKDVRRLVSFATTIDNAEKVNIVKRVVLAAQKLGVDTVYFMPDNYFIAQRLIDGLELEDALEAEVKVLDMICRNDMSDSVHAAQMMEEIGVDCIIVLGGDGTSRAVAKGITDTPLIPISTGTNNVYPRMVEGTVVGMAAAAVAKIDDADKYCLVDKIIEIKKNGEFADLALIDAVISDDLWSGSKAIWDTRKMSKVIVTRCHPASIGFSAIVGAKNVITEDEPRGMFVDLGETGEYYRVPIAAGLMTDVHITDSGVLELDEPYDYPVENGCMVALDGEREVYAAPGDVLTFTIKQAGPKRVLMREILAAAVEQGFFKL